MRNRYDELPDRSAELSAMELFLLAALATKRIRTLYDLKKELGISPGGIGPAFNRLLRDGLVQKGEGGVHGRKEFKMTEAGLSALRKRWEWSLRETRLADLDAVLRLAWVVLRSNKPIAIQFLEDVAALRSKAAEKRHADADQLLPGISDSIVCYRWLQAMADAQRLQAEGAAAKQIATELEKNLKAE